MTNKIADTFNEYGKPVTMFWCDGCKSTFTVCPPVEDEHLDQWTGCLGANCSTYDPERDADKLFDEGKVLRRGDRSHFKVIEGGPALSAPGSEKGAGE